MASPDEQEKSAPLPLAAYVVLSGLLALHAWLYFDFKIDDAFILLRYADNLRHGFGLTFNVGERVEGFTSPALVVLEAAFLRLGWDGLIACKVLGTLCGLALVAASVRLAGLATASRWATFGAGLMVVAQPAVGVACVNGLETMPFAACIAWTLYLSLTARGARDAALLGAVVSLAMLLRPEGTLALALATACIAVRNRSGAWRPMLGALLAAPLLVAAPLLLWKASYFHSFVPNTYLAKVPARATGRFQSGFTYLFDWSRTQWEPIGLVCLWIAGARARRGPVAPIAVFAVIWTASVVYTGGDWIPLRRFLIPLLPAAAVGLVLAVEAVVAWAGRLASRASIGTLAVGAACAVWLVPGTAMGIADAVQATAMFTVGSTVGREPLGQWLYQLHEPSATVALVDVGAVSYLSEMNVIDLGGLTDAPIARLMNRSHGRFITHLFFPSVADSRRIVEDVLHRRPEFIVLELFGDYPHIPAKSFEADPPPALGAHPQEQAFILSPELRKSYRYVCQFHERRQLEYNVFVRADYPQKLTTVVDGDGRVYCPIP